MLPFMEMTGVDTYLGWNETGFGDDNENRARFAIVLWAEFDEEATYQERGITGTKRVKRQLTVQSPLRVSYDIITNQANLARLRSMVNTTNTLYIPADASIYLDTSYESLNGEVYGVMRNIKLLNVRQAVNYGQGRVKAVIDLVRDDDGDRYGLATYAVEE